MKCQRELYKKNKINNKVAINSQLSIIAFKKQISKQLEQEQNYIWRLFGGLPFGRGNGEKRARIKKHKW